MLLVAVAGLSTLSSGLGLVGLWFYTGGADSASGKSSSSAPQEDGSTKQVACDPAACDAAMASLVDNDASFDTSSGTVSACAGCPQRAFKWTDDQTARVLSKKGCPDLVTPGSVPETDRPTLWKSYLGSSNSSCSSPQGSQGNELKQLLTKTACAAAIAKKMESLDASCGTCPGNACWNEFSTLPECSGCLPPGSIGMCYSGDGKPAWFKKFDKNGKEVSDDTKSFSSKSSSDLKWSKWFVENGLLETCSATTPTAVAQPGRLRNVSRVAAKPTAPKISSTRMVAVPSSTATRRMVVAQTKKPSKR